MLALCTCTVMTACDGAPLVKIAALQFLSLPVCKTCTLTSCNLDKADLWQKTMY